MTQPMREIERILDIFINSEGVIRPNFIISGNVLFSYGTSEYPDKY